MKKYAELRGNPENSGIKSLLDNINWYQEFGTAHQSGTAHFRPGADATKAKMGQLALQANDLDDWLRLVASQWSAETKSRAPVLTGNLRDSYSVEEL